MIAVAKIADASCVSSPMRSANFTLILSLLAMTFAHGAEVEIKGANRKLPQFRPAVLASGKDSLVNRIRVPELLAKKQKAGAVMFCSIVNDKGNAESSWTYRGMPGTEALEAEMNHALEGIKYAPAVYNHQHVGVMLFGTVVFSEEPPYIHVFLNQEPSEFGAATDFISPQPVYGADSKFTGLHLEGVDLEVPVNGIVELALKVDAKGNLQGIDCMGEDPPLIGFGGQALDDFRPAKFIPAFRDGDPADCVTRLHVAYQVAATGE